MNERKKEKVILFFFFLKKKDKYLLLMMQLLQFHNSQQLYMQPNKNKIINKIEIKNKYDKIK